VPSPGDDATIAAHPWPDEAVGARLQAMHDRRDPAPRTAAGRVVDAPRTPADAADPVLAHDRSFAP